MYTEDDVRILADAVIEHSGEEEYFFNDSWRDYEENPFKSAYCAALKVWNRDGRGIVGDFIDFHDLHDGWIGPDIGNLIDYIKEAGFEDIDDPEKLVEELLPEEYKKYKNNSDYLVEM